MQIYEYLSCYFVGFALSLLVLYISGVRKKLAFYIYSVNAAAGLVLSLVALATQKADSLFLVAGGFAGVAGQSALCLVRLAGAFM